MILTRRGKKGTGRRGSRRRTTTTSQCTRLPWTTSFYNEEDERAGDNPVVTMIDEQTKDKYARIVSQKGMGSEGEMEWLIKDMKAELMAWGHPPESHLIMKCDGESAMKMVRDALMRAMGGRVVLEQAAKGESQSNGSVEEAGKTIREFTRVFKEQLQDKIGEYLGPHSEIMQWIVRWAAMCCSRYVVGKDGRTAWERRRGGRKCSIPVASFGESVWFKELGDMPRRGKMTSDVKAGIWLGHHREANEAIVGTDDGVFRAYTVQRRPKKDRWDAQAIKRMRGTPSQRNPNEPGVKIPARVETGPAAEEASVPKTIVKPEDNTRRFRIDEALMEKHGRTPGCQGCSHKDQGWSDHRKSQRSMQEEDDGGDQERSSWKRDDTKGRGEEPEEGEEGTRWDGRKTK